jgi:hypothetical protein
VLDKAPDVSVPDWDDPELRFWDFDDKPIASTKDWTLFRVLPDKKLAPSRIELSDTLYRTCEISREEALELSSFRTAS